MTNAAAHFQNSVSRSTEAIAPAEANAVSSAVPGSAAPKGTASVTLKSNKLGEATLSGRTKDIPTGGKIELIIIDSEGNTVRTVATVIKNAYSVKTDIKGLVDGPLNVLAVTANKNGDQVSEIAEFQKNLVKGGLSVSLSDISDPSKAILTGEAQDVAAGSRVLIEIKAANGTAIKAAAVVGSDGCYVTTADLTMIPDGIIKISASSMDRNGNLLSAKASASLDAVEGALTISTTYGPTKIEFSGKTTDVAPGHYVSLTITKADGSEVKISAKVAADGTFSVTRPLSLFSDGPITVDATAKDRNGNVLTAEASGGVQDGAISVIFEEPRSETPHQATIRGTTSEVLPGQTVILTITDHEGTSIRTTATVQKDGTYLTIAELRGLLDGELTVTAAVADKKGNPVTSEGASELDLVKGSLNVSFVNAADAAKTVITGQVFDLDRNGEVAILVTDSEGRTIEATAVPETRGGFRITTDLTGLADGKLIITASATDRNGNALSSKAETDLDLVDGDISVSFGPLSDMKSVWISGSTTDIRAGSNVTLVATDSEGAEVRIVAKVLENGSYATTADLSELKVGPISVEASATDRNGGLLRAEDTETPIMADVPDVPGIPVENSDPVDRSESVEAISGRVTLIDTSELGDVQSIRILSQGEYGQVSVNADNSISLVLSGTSQDGPLSFRYEVVYDDGRTEIITTDVAVSAGSQKNGWGLGQSYKLETDENDNSVIEHGDNHRKVYVSSGDHALSFADIAQKEGLPVSAINGSWLSKNPQYGISPETALDEKAGIALWHAITGSKAPPSSHWLLLESGHSYDELGVILKRGTQGESELHPVVIAAYGEGGKPIIEKTQVYNTPNNHNIVIKGIALHDGIQMIQGKNYLVEDVSIRNDGLTAIQIDGFTLRNSDIIDVVRDKSVVEGNWSPHINRISGVFANDIAGLLIENNYLDRVGWADDYKSDLSLAGGQPPSIYSQGLYLSFGNSDLTLRDNILMRAASFGAQVRSGGVIEDNIFLDNNAAVTIPGGYDKGTYGEGNYSLLLGNIITSGAHRAVTEGPKGALTMGVDNSGRMTTMIGNIVAHLADPDNPAELTAKPVTHKPVSNKSEAFFDDTIIYNWAGAKSVAAGTRIDKNVEGLNQNVLDDTTIQNFTAQLLGKKTATIADLATFLRGQAEGKLDGEVDADIINAFFRTGFGMETTIRDESEAVRFSPNALADGVRWDNRLNWSTDDKPINGDSIDLGGNRVFFGNETVIVDDFDFGRFGSLEAASGKLTIRGNITVSKTGALLEVDNAGQVWVGGYSDSDLLRVDVSGGRFANTGVVSGRTEMSVSDNGQLLLAMGESRFDLTAGSSLTVVGSKSKVGIDGLNKDVGLIRLLDGSTVKMISDANGFSKIGEFRSGALQVEKSASSSGIALGGDLDINVDVLAGANKNGTYCLIEADELIFDFKSIDIEGLDSDTDAIVRIDYNRDLIEVILENGTGQSTVEHIGAAGLDMNNKALVDIFGEYMSY